MRLPTGLSRQLLGLILGCALLLSVPVGIVNLDRAYHQASELQRREVDTMIALFRQPLQTALWNFDDATARHMLADLDKFPAVHSADLTAPDLDVHYLKSGVDPSAAGDEATYALHSPDGRRQLGAMRVRLDRAALAAAAWQSSVRFMLLVVLELVLLAFAIFFVVQRFVTTPVRALSRHVQGMTPDGLDVEAPEPSTRANNELHDLARGVTALQHQLRDRLAERDALTDTLRASEQRVQHMADSIPNMLWTAREDGALEYMSQRGLTYFGCTLAELTEDAFSRLVHPEDLGRHFKARKRAVADRTAYQIDLRLRRHDGEYRWHSVMAIAQPDDAQRLLKWFGSCTDITERKRSEERLLQSEKLTAIGELAGGIAHDFNNQLTAIIGSIDLLDEVTEDPAVLELAEGAKLAAMRSADLTRNLLSYARVGARQTMAVDLHGVIDETTVLLKRSIDKRITIVRKLNAAQSVVDGDPAQLQNALLNLALNARDAMESGGTLTFETELIAPQASAGETAAEARASPRLRVSVRDTGSGMSEGVKARLFEPFFTTKGHGKGTGLGLASVYGTVESHQGQISVESEEGQGTCFRLVFPLGEGTAPAHSRPPAGPAHRALQILLADDEPQVRETIAAGLRSAGHHVIAVKDGMQAVARHQEGTDTIDLTILDHMMPGLSGVDAFREIKKLNPRARVLLCSGYGELAEVQAALSEGIAGYLAKPFELETLKRAIAAAVTASEPPPAASE